ncbi:MAG: hypothetical protein J2P37_18340 [Ktedonobacteraceae bacterium]|nr:hypothetical protein [Ktedonobacteraceae bacterium]MBO0790258.1 hypothetical protein [Ktedonobacteraceae bacterium]
MSKVKMRCITCGKWFQSANAKEVTCPDCMQKVRKEKLAQKNAPPTSNKPTRPVGSYSPASRPAPPRPKPSQSGTAHWLDNLNDVKVSQPESPARSKPSPPAISRGGPSPYREGGNRGPGGYRDEGRGNYRGPGGYREGGYSGSLGQRYRPPQEDFPGRGPRPDRPRFGGPRNGAHKPKPKATRPPAPPRPKREKIPPPAPFVPTSEQVQQIETRYLELAVPNEFDGIRTQIAKELSIPKKAVKKIIKELRAKREIPSWWELQTYKGSQEELDKIRVVYEPFLPLPPVGVHKQIAEQLNLKPGTTYQAIKTIRLEMNLPQYNAPELHGDDFLTQLQSASKKKNEDLPPTAEGKAHEGEDLTPTAEDENQKVEDAVAPVAVPDTSEEQKQ